MLKLAALRRHMAPELRRMGGMMCLQTIERSRFGRQGKLNGSDRLQLEGGNLTPVAWARYVRSWLLHAYWAR